MRNHRLLLGLGKAERNHLPAIAAFCQVFYYRGTFCRGQKLLHVSRELVGIRVDLWLRSGTQSLPQRIGDFLHFLIRTLILLERCRTRFLQPSSYVHGQKSYVYFERFFGLSAVHASGLEAGQHLFP